MIQVQSIDYKELFGSDSGESESPNALRSYFVDLDKFSDFYSNEYKLQIVRAKKGMGKSSLLKRLAIRLKDTSQDIVISTTGNDLLGMGEFSQKSSTYLENHWKQVICKRICVEIGKQINVAFTDNSISMVEAAELEGFKGLNVVSALTDRIGGILQNIFAGATDDPGKVGGGGFLKKGVSNPIEAVRRFQEQGDRTVWILIDDIDAKYIDNEEYQQIVGGFFSAIRWLSNSVEGLRIRASVRADVWRSLRLSEDQDKIREFVIDIKWRDADLRSMFAKRILGYFQRTGVSGADKLDSVRDYRSLMESIFEGHFYQDGEKLIQIGAYPFIKNMAGARPRWMGQLCKMAGAHAGHGRINGFVVDHVMSEFGFDKLTDVLKEHVHQFADLNKLVNIFRAGESGYSRFRLISLIEKEYVKKVNGEVPIINGYRYTELDQLAQLLFGIDFIYGYRNGEKGEISFFDDPDLFSSNENNKNTIISWRVNPSYRKYLRIQR